MKPNQQSFKSTEEKIFCYELYPCKSRLREIAFYMTHDNVEADELVQATYCKALENLDSYQEGTNPVAWLRIIMLNIFRKKIRKATKKVKSGDGKEDKVRRITYVDSWESIDTNSSEISFEETGFENLVLDFSDEVILALTQLSEHQLQILKLQIFDEQDYKSISKIMKMPIGTVKSQRAKIKQILIPNLESFALDQYNIHQ